MKEGYKQTELGVIPEDWKIKKLGDIGDFKNGINKSKEDFGFGIHFVNINDIFNSNVLNKIDDLDLVNAKPNEQKIYSLAFGDIVFVRSSVKPEGVGLTSLISFNDKNVVYSGFVIRFRLFEENLISHNFKKFLFYEIGFRSRLMAKSSISANTNINQESLKTLSIPVPPIEEQNAIANCLSIWDEAIEKQQELIDTKEIRHKALMQKLLSGKKRLPGFTDEWKEVKIKDLGEIKTGNTPSKNNSDYWGDEFYWCTADDMKNKYIYHTKLRLSSLGKEKARIVPENSILVTCIASIGINAITKVKTGFNQQINSITPNNDFDVEFIYYLINNNKSKLLEYAGAGALPMLNKNTFMEIAFKIPVLNEQLAISNILKTSEAEIEIEKKKVEQLKEQKKALMQKLLTGKVRLPLNN